jgi:hypothetical protein
MTFFSIANLSHPSVVLSKPQFFLAISFGLNTVSKSFFLRASSPLPEAGEGKGEGVAPVFIHPHLLPPPQGGGFLFLALTFPNSFS